MKKLVLVLCFVFLFVPMAMGGEVTVDFEWDANTESYLAGYKAYVGDAAGGPYTEFADILKPTTEVSYIYNAPDGVTTTKYFVVTAYRNEPFLESGNSNEVFMVYDFAPIVSPTEFAASLEGDVVTFTWTQVDIERIKKWRLYISETSGVDYTELALIEYTGEGGPQYSTTETMSVPAGEKKTFYFVLVAYTPRGVFSPNSTEVSVTIDKQVVVPVYNLRIKVIN